ncbi:MAG: ribosome maturation factor RimP [Clostridia bacterium]|nr:ribosome maturation factor RimP [Clostridia bacterium]
MKKDVESVVSALAEPICKEQGLELYDVEYVKEGGIWYLRIYIDAEDGVDIEQCENISRALDPVLDAADPIKEAYYLEVSSVGLDRHLKKEKDFHYFMGCKIEVKLYRPVDGRKEFVGTLTDFAEGSFTIETEKESITFTQKEAAMVRPYVEF